MPSEKAKKWIEAVKALGEDPDKKIVCPNCNVGYLYIKDLIIKKEKNVIGILFAPIVMPCNLQDFL